MGPHMFAKGTRHGVVIFTLMMSVSFLGSFSRVGTENLELILLATLFLPLLIVGYRYKSKIGRSLLEAFLDGERTFIFYPPGIAIFTALLTLYGVYDSTAKIGTLFLPVLYVFLVLGHSFTIGAVIWMGSWFKR